MSEQLIEPKKHLALDMDWITAGLAVVCFLFCALATGVAARRIFRGAPVTTQINWQSVFLLLVSAWLTVAAQVRAVKFALGLFSLSVASRLLLAILHASVATQIANAEVMRVVDLVIYIGVCIGVLVYFKQRIKHV